VGWQRQHPTQRSDGLNSPVTELRQRIDDKVRKQQRLAADITAKEHLLEQLQAVEDEQQLEAKKRAAEAAIKEAVRSLASAWTAFVQEAESTRSSWRRVVDAAQALDSLPDGSPRSIRSRAISRPASEKRYEPTQARTPSGLILAL
jgi:chromosome segregation ATPase